MTPRIPTAGQVCGTLALAAFFWWVNFGLHWVNFMVGMGTAASVLALLSFWFAGVPMKRTEWTGRAVLIGLVSAALLYAIFALGNTLSGWLFRFAPHQVSWPSTISAMKVRRSPWRWYCFSSPAPPRRFLAAASSSAGSCTASAERPDGSLRCAFTPGVHVFSGNPHVGHGRPDGGPVLGLALLETGSLVPCILSHAFWTVAVFILWPLTRVSEGGRKREGVAHKKAGLFPAFWCRLFTAP